MKKLGMWLALIASGAVVSVLAGLRTVVRKLDEAEAWES